MFFSFVVISLLFLFTLANYIVFEITAFNRHERNYLYLLHIKLPMVVFLNGVSNEAAIPMTVIVKNEMAKSFESKLQYMEIQYTFVTLIITNNFITSMNKSSKTFKIYNNFYDWDTIENWTAESKKTTLGLDKVVVAKTYKKRDISILKITKGRKKPIVFIVGGEDGMDWMSSSIILNLLQKIIENKSELDLLTKYFDFYLIPVLNPDGFVYSKIKDRFWSKNRRVIYPQKSCLDGLAIGVNIARNWFFQKNKKVTEEECNSVYIGHKALSQEETKALSYILNNLALDIMAFINVRGFGRYITIPYGYTSMNTNNHDIVMDILRSTCSKVFEKHNVTYYLGTTTNFLYNFSGNVADWVKAKLNIPLVYTSYLEDVSTVLPQASQIEPLTQQFITILNQSLLISKDIYAPLYNKQLCLHCYIIILIILLTILHFVTYIYSYNL